MLSLSARASLRLRPALTPAARSLSTYFTEEHEYIKVDGNIGTIGISDFAQNALGDVVFVEVPSPGDSFTKGEAMGSIESVKAASDVYSPCAGTVVSVNDDLEENPSLVNDSPLEDGWFITLEISDDSELSGLMDEAAYEEYVASQEDH